jgi:hypothetical protein
MRTLNSIIHILVGLLINHHSPEGVIALVNKAHDYSWVLNILITMINLVIMITNCWESECFIWYGRIVGIIKICLLAITVTVFLVTGESVLNSGRKFQANYYRENFKHFQAKHSLMKFKFYSTTLTR